MPHWVKFTLGPDLCCASLWLGCHQGLWLQMNSRWTLSKKDHRQPSALSYTPLTSMGLPGVSSEQNLISHFNMYTQSPPKWLSTYSAGSKNSSATHAVKFFFLSEQQEKAILPGKRGWSCFACRCMLLTFSERKGDRMPLGPVCCTPPAATHGNMPTAGRMQQLHFKCPVPLADKLLHECRYFWNLSVSSYHIPML